MTNTIIRQSTKNVDKMLSDLINSYESEKMVYGSVDGIPEKQIERIFTISDDKYFKQMVHINKSKIIVVDKSCLNYGLIKHCGFVVQLRFAMSETPEPDSPEEQEIEFLDFI